MKKIKLLNAAILLIISLMAYCNAEYKIPWHTIDGGGGTSSGGQYSLTGTIGQPDAEYSASEQYELFGGFWPLAPSCIVNFEDFAYFADYWLMTGLDLPADLYKDQYNIVDYYDLDAFVYQWLFYCPYDWPLK